MSDMDRHSEPQQHKTAAEYRQAADEHVRTLKDFWKDFENSVPGMEVF